MIFRVILLLVIFALFIVWVDVLNPGNVNVMLPGDITVTPSKIALMLGSAAFGALVVLIGIYIKATTDFFVNWKRNRTQQKDIKVHALYSKGLDALLSRRPDIAATYFEKVLALNPNH